MTGLIYVVIIALWAAVLIPIWLRRHDQISEVRSTARFSSAMNKLGSQGQVQYATDSYALDSRMLDTRSLEMTPPPMRSPEREARMPRSTTRPAEGMDPDYERELVRQSAATRRAVVLGALTVALLLTLILAMVGVVPRWAPILAALPVVAFVLAAAMTASERTTAKPARRAAAHPARAARPAPESASAPAAGAADDDWETWNAWDDDESWEAVPATLPTYVSAPRASAVPRGIDRAHPGEWTGEAMIETAQAMRSRPRSAPLADPADIDHGATTAEIPVVHDDYGTRRAVNE